MSIDSSASWPRESISVRPDGTVIVDWKNAGLTDDTLNDFVNKRLSLLLSSVPNRNGKATECNVILSGNRLSAPEAIAGLLKKLREAKVHVTALNLHSNMLADDIHSVIGEHIREAGRARLPLASLRLGDNKLTEVAVRSITDAVLQSGAYPSSSVQHCRIWVESQSPPLRCAPDLEALGASAKNESAVCILLGMSSKQSKGEGKGKGTEVCRASTTPTIDETRIGGKSSNGKDKGFKGEKKSSDYSVEDETRNGGKASNGKGKGFKGEKKFSDDSVEDETRIGGKASNGKGKGFKGEKKSSDDSVEDETRIGGKLSNGKGKGFKGERKSSDDSLLAWLKEHRENTEFEQIWKSWCANHEIAGIPKAQRIEKIACFKLEWESGSLKNARNGHSSKTDKLETSSREGGAMDRKEPKSLLPTLASLPSTDAIVPPLSQAVNEPKAPQSVDANKNANLGEAANIMSKAVAAVKLKLKTAVEMKTLHKSLNPDREPGSEWQRLAHIGNQAIEQGCSLRAFRLGGSFLDEDGLSELNGTCTSKSNLAHAYHSLNLVEYVHDDKRCTDKQKASSLAAVVGELEDPVAESSRTAEFDFRSEIAKAILDFVFLFGYRSIANVTGMAESSTTPVAMTKNSTTPADEAAEYSTPPVAVQEKVTRTSPCEDWLSMPVVDSDDGPQRGDVVSEQQEMPKAQVSSLLNLAETVPDQCKDFPIGSRVMTIRRDKCICNSKISELLQLKHWDTVHKKVASDEHFIVTGSCLWKDDPLDGNELEIVIIAVRDKDRNEKLLDAECLQKVSLKDLGKSHLDALQDYIDPLANGSKHDMAPSELTFGNSNMKQSETELEARERRLQAQAQRRVDQKWNYTGASRSTADAKEANSRESNQAAMQRMLGSRLDGKSIDAPRPNRTN